MTILLVDCDNFYVSCERIFCPRLNGRPVLVLSNNDGIVVARSKEAKALGIPMGAPRFQWEDIIIRNNIEVFSSNYEFYGSMSRRVMNVLNQFSPEVEIYSIDEAFLHYPDTASIAYAEIATQIRQTVLQWTGLPVTVGIGATKTIAKVAVEFAKKETKFNGILDLTDTSILDGYLTKLSVGDVWGVGRRYAEMLAKKNITTARALRDLPDGWVRKRMTVVGLRTVWELRGISCLSLELAPPAKQSIICSRSFGRPIETLPELKEAVATYVSRATERLRRQSSVAAGLQIFIETNRFKDEPHYGNAITYRLEQPTAYTPDLVRIATTGVERIFQNGYQYKRAGAMLLEITPQDRLQRGFWGREYNEREKKAMAVVDQINARFGKGTIKVAATGLKQSWQMRSEMRSPRYTTRWGEIPVAIAS
jgi:DNA polymerase V